jgi:hypothetical protein
MAEVIKKHHQPQWPRLFNRIAFDQYFSVIWNDTKLPVGSSQARLDAITSGKTQAAG